MRSPVLFLIFNRPRHTKSTFAAIRKAAPPRLYIAADGPRSHKADEGILCEQARATATAVDWPCEVKTLFRNSNMGCAKAVSSALTWFFKHEPEGIVLEDDLLPHPDFFPFCDNMLEYWRDTDKIMHIGSNNFQFGIRRGSASYYFSCIQHCWGWASWARAWQHFDYEMTGLNNFLRDELPGMFTSPDTLEYFQNELTSTQKGTCDSWAFRWTYSIWKNNGLCIIPNMNLVGNFGFDSKGTHTMTKNIFTMVPVQPLGTLTHGNILERDYDADDSTGRLLFSCFGNSLTSLLVECVARLESGQLEGARILLNRTRECFGQSPKLLHIDALIALREGDRQAASQHVETLCASFSEYAANNNILSLVRATRA
jgi:hypothetical protein